MGLNLTVQVQIQDDASLAVTGTTTVEELSTQTVLNSADYDGATFFFEIYGKSSSTMHAQTFDLFDKTNGVVRASVTTSNTSDTRVRSASFTPASGDINYDLRLTAGASTETVTCFEARIIIVQTNATKTAIYVPLGRASGVNETSVTDIEDASIEGRPRWRFDSSQFGDSVTIFFESTLRINGASTASVSLYNMTDNTSIVSVTTTNTAYTNVRSASISLTNLKDYGEKVNSGSGTISMNVGNAKIIVKITSLSKVEVPIKVAWQWQNTSTIETPNPDRLANINTADYSAGFTSLYEAAMAVSVNTITATARLKNNTTGTDITSSDLTTTSTTVVNQLSPTITLTSGSNDYVGTGQLSAAGTQYTDSAFVLIRVTSVVVAIPTRNLLGVGL